MTLVRVETPVLPPVKKAVNVEPNRSILSGMADAARESFENERRGKGSTGALISSAMLTVTGAALQGFMPATSAGIEMVDMAPNPRVDLASAKVPKIPDHQKRMLREQIPLV